MTTPLIVALNGALTSALTRTPIGALAALVASPLLAGELRFDPAPVPETTAEKRAILTSDVAEIDGVRVPFRYRTILRSGQLGVERSKSTPFGQLHDFTGAALTADDGSPVISTSHDFSSLLRGEDGELYMVSHFESRPGAIYLTALAQDPGDGRLTALYSRPLDLARLNGGWTHCAGSVTPWGTHLGSEEYEPDAAQWRDAAISDYNAAMARYFLADPIDAAAVVNPYDYGYPIEIKVSSANEVEIAKHMAMGRISLELAYVMPDRKTVYLSDDGNNVGLFRFVADRPGDLSSGHLWAARWDQKSDQGAGTAAISWIPLGWASDALARAWANRYQFADIFDEAEPVVDGGEDTGTCPDGFTAINAGHRRGDHQCLALKDVDQDGLITPRDDAIASRLETRRWAAMRGATTEFRKMEGITYSPDEHRLYLALSELDRGMRDFGRAGVNGPSTDDDLGGQNHIRLAASNRCGAVYGLHLDANYTAVSMFPVVVGTPLTTEFGADTDSPQFDGINHCALSGIANPDNITYIPGYRTLVIGEDSGAGHQNDMVWAFHTERGELTRIQTTPYGSETTSLYFYPDLNGFAYLMSVVQHPYGESDADKLQRPDQARGYTGYFVLPAMRQ